MRVETTRFGALDVNPEACFAFPMGILGFSKCKDFVVLDHAEDSPFKWLQAIDEPDLAFIISDPQFFKPDYHLKVRKGELSIIEPVQEGDLVVSVIMTVPDDPQEMTANLMAPLVFNMANRRGMQLVLHDQRYPVRFRVFGPTAEETPDPSRPEPPVVVHEPRSISLT